MSRVSVVIINWNGRHFLAGCLDSVLAQTCRELEVILVDCASRDSSVDFVKEKYSAEPRLKIISLQTDPGPSAAINYAAKMAAGAYVLILNNDVILPADCLEILLAEAAKDKQAVFNPVQLNFKGQFIPWSWHEPWFSSWLYLLVKPFKKVNGYSTFYLSTACCLVSKEILLASPFNEHLFMYDEAEWAWRLFLKNIKPRILFTTYFLHADAGTVKGTKKQAYVSGRNAVAAPVICLTTPGLILLWPILLLECLRRILLYSSARRFALAAAYFNGMVSVLKDGKIFRADRRQVQRERQKNDYEVIKFMIQSRAYAPKFRAAALKAVERFNLAGLRVG